MSLQMIGVSLSGSFPQGLPAIGEMLDNARRVERLGFDALWCWLGYLVSSNRLREALHKIQDMAPTYGRQPMDIQGGMLLFTTIARDYETARQMAIAHLSRRYNQPFEHVVDRYCAMGTPDQCLEKIQAYIDAGMSNLAFSFTSPADQVTEQIEWCAADLLPRLRS